MFSQSQPLHGWLHRWLLASRSLFVTSFWTSKGVFAPALPVLPDARKTPESSNAPAARAPVHEINLPSLRLAGHHASAK